jgi:hypothetical protein
MNSLKTTSTFKLVFFTVVGLTLLSGGTSVWLASQEQLSPPEVQVFQTSSETWQTGIGAVFGLLGGQAANLLQQEENKEDKDKIN